MDVSGRKLQILNIIIHSYMMTGEPVGSRTISKFPGLNISSATVRNEMADLEDGGYIIQPHTSAGRIPTDKAYRLYVNNLLIERSKELDEKQKEIDEKNNILNEKFDKLEQFLHSIAVNLANKTDYTTLVTQATSNKKIKFIQISLVDEYKLILVCVTKENIIKNHIVDIQVRVTEQDLLKMNFVFNTNLSDKIIEEINITDIADIKKQLTSIDDSIINQVLDALANMFYSDKDFEIYTGGTTNILKYPELSNNNNFAGLLTEIVEKQELTKFMNEASSKDSQIQIYIGDESKISNMDNCSLVTMNFNINKSFKSTIGIIGPKRMDYEKVIKNLEGIREQINKLFNK